VVAVLGTLLGSVVTYAFQRAASRRDEVFTRSESLRRERMAAYGAFAVAAEEYRRGQAERWYRRQENAEGEEFVVARDEAHRLRTVVRQAVYQVKLLTDDGDVVLAAERAYEDTRDVSRARDQADWAAQDARSRLAIESFVSRASPLVR
jgi:hypothetical protein